MTAVLDSDAWLSERRRGPLDWPAAVHVILLGVVLLAGLMFVGVDSIISADEGAALTQARLIERGSWGVEYPAIDIDTTGRWFPIHLTTRVGDRWYPYTKLPAYPALVSTLDSIGGLGLVLGGHVLGTVAAAAFAGMLARRLARSLEKSPAESPAESRASARSLEVLTIWAVGIGSPLVFDSYWVIAHSIAAAGATLAILGMTMTFDDERRRGLLAIAVGVAVAVMFRSEGVLLGLAVASGCAFGWLRTRRVAPALGSALAGMVTVAGYLGNAALDRSIVGGDSIVPFSIRDRVGWLEGRVPGFAATFLKSQLWGSTLTAMLTLASALLLATAVIAARRSMATPRVIGLLAALGAVAALVRCVLEPIPVPGILLTFPIGVAGLCLLGRRHLRNVAVAGVLVVVGLVVAAVVATQYSAGATGDWGGRYLHVIVPAFAAVSVIVIADTLGSLDRRAARSLGIGVAVASVSLAVLGVRSIEAAHDREAALTDTVAEVAAGTASARDIGGPVVLTDSVAFGRFAWKYVLDGRYLSVDRPSELDDAADALVHGQVSEFTLVTPARGAADTLDRLAGHYRPVTEGRRLVRGWIVVRMSAD